MEKQCDSLRKMVQKISYKPIAVSTGPLLGASSFPSSFVLFDFMVPGISSSVSQVAGKHSSTEQCSQHLS